MAKIISITYEDEMHNPMTYTLNFDENVRPEDVPKMLMHVLDKWSDSKKGFYRPECSEGIVSVYRGNDKVARYNCNFNGVSPELDSLSLSEVYEKDFPCLLRIFKDLGIDRERFTI